MEPFSKVAQELRDEITGRKKTDRRGDVEALRVEALGTVNGYFHDRLVALPEVAAYLDEIAAEHVD